MLMSLKTRRRLLRKLNEKDIIFIMKIYLAKYYGFCSGVRLAVKKANNFYN